MLPDWIRGPSELLLATAAVVLAAMFVINLLFPPAWFSISLGYSMCSERYPYMDFTSLRETRCSVIPGDALIFTRVSPRVGDIACVFDRPRGGIICHRVYEVNATHVCIVGDAARWRDCYPLEPVGDKYYVGKVVAKVPRAVSMPAVIVWGILHGNPKVVRLIDMGSYSLAR